LVLSALAVAVLVVSVVIQVWVLPTEAASVGATFPEVALLVVPGVAWGVLAIACWQVAAVFGLRVVVLARQYRFEVAHGWLLATVGCLLAFLVLVVAAFIALSVMGYTTAGVMLGLIDGGLLGLAVVGALGALARVLASVPVAASR
jgi:hypothetical protein